MVFPPRKWSEKRGCVAEPPGTPLDGTHSTAPGCDLHFSRLSSRQSTSPRRTAAGAAWAAISRSVGGAWSRGAAARQAAAVCRLRGSAMSSVGPTSPGSTSTSVTTGATREATTAVSGPPASPESCTLVSATSLCSWLTTLRCSSADMVSASGWDGFASPHSGAAGATPLSWAQGARCVGGTPPCARLLSWSRAHKVSSVREQVTAIGVMTVSSA
mmetsp:Transcript_48207/g.109271  ORF Transcript_48207/g.109271 Transcript_48207/m.109271 type:complete len:215 (-) Transcript_48207:134-778(-)